MLAEKETDEDIKKRIEATDFTEFDRFARETKLGDYDSSLSAHQGARMQWDKFMVASDIEWS